MRFRVLGTASVLSLLLVGGGAVAVAANGSDGPGFGVDPIGPPREAVYGVEDGQYPGAAQLAAETNILLKKGDGNILYTECTSDAKLIRIRSSLFNREICFQPMAETGWLSMEIPGSFRAKASSQSTMKLISTTLDQQTSVVDFEKNQNKNVEVQRQEVTVVEIRLPNVP
jgi:hypothetical protein